jgi:poly(3-hydroxybutyrate) depolymerase
MRVIRLLCRVLLLAAALPLAPSHASGQALTSLLSLQVSYNTRKATLNPTGELKARLDSVDRDLAAATRVGRTSEARRLLAKGFTLLAGRPWTDVADYNASLVLRSDRVVLDSRNAYVVRLEQLYAPDIDLARSVSAHATLVARPAVGGGRGAAPPTLIKDFGTLTGVSRDLRESPFAIELDVHDVPDGQYVLAVEVLDSARTLGTASLPVALKKGLDETVARLEGEAQRAPESLRAELLYPVDRMRNVNRGQLELRTLDVDKDFAAADAIAAAVKSGKDPFAGRTGDMKRHYRLEAANEVMPYHVYVPTTYASTRSMPLIIALHGLGGTEDSFFDSYGKKLPELAEQHGYILAAPLGYRVDGRYGLATSADPVARRASELSEADVMQVLANMRKLYNVDPKRIYLMGHSMGAIGTWAIAPKHPDIWAALAPFSGQGAPATAERIKNIAEFVVHGDADPTVNVRGSRTMVAALKAVNADVTYIEVPGGNHMNVVEPNFAAMMQFFNTHKKGAATTP